MSLQPHVDVLTDRFRTLALAIHDLRMTAVEDQPPGSEQLVIATVSEAVEELAGWIFEALTEATAAGEALRHDDEAGAAIGHLLTCQQRLNRINAGTSTDLVSYETYAELSRLAHDHGGEWPGWLAMLRLGLDTWRSPLPAVQAALLDCWQEALAGIRGPAADRPPWMRLPVVGPAEPDGGRSRSTSTANGGAHHAR